MVCAVDAACIDARYAVDSVMRAGRAWLGVVGAGRGVGCARCVLLLCWACRARKPPWDAALSMSVFVSMRCALCVSRQSPWLCIFLRSLLKSCLRSPCLPCLVRPVLRPLGIASKLGAPSSMPVLRPLGIASELRRIPSKLEQGKVVIL